MGHYVEYLLRLSPTASREWLGQFDSIWLDAETPNHPPSGEVRLWGTFFVQAELGPACRLVLPMVKYTWLIAGWEGAVAQVTALEDLLVEAFPQVDVIRIDETLRSQWERDRGGTWDRFPDPVLSLRHWIENSNPDPRYYRFLSERTT